MENSIKKIFTDEKKYWLIASFFSITVIVLAMVGAEVFIGGKFAYVSSDLYEQVAGFSGLFYKKVFEGSNIYYSFETGLGMNTSLLFAFYTFSPFSILYMVLGIEGVNIASIIIFIVKIGLSAAFFQLYCQYNLKVSGRLSVFVSMCYALMAYAVYISRMNPLYDAVYMLPLVFILIKYSIDRRSFYFLSLAYVYIFVINFYGGYIVGITSFVYFIYYVISNSINIRARLKVIVSYCVAVVVAILISGFILAPALYEALSQHVIENADSFSIVPIWKQLLYLFPFHSSDMYLVSPSYYSGIPILFMCPAFFFNSGISSKKKCVAFIALLVCVLSLTIRPLYLAGHMFNDPTGYSCRYIYIFAFFLISMFAVSFKHFAETDYKKVIVCDVLFLMIYIIAPALDKLFGGKSFDTGGVYFGMTILLSVLWMLIIFMLGKNGATSKQQYIYIFAFLLLGIELGFNNYYMLHSMEHQTIDGQRFVIADTSKMIADLQDYDDGTYRIQYNESNNCNQGSMIGYMGSTLFASSSNSNLKSFLKSIGVFCNEFMITDCGNTDITRLLLDEKYIVNGRRELEYDKETNIMLNENVAGMGFAVSKDIVNYKGAGTVFENQNEICERFGYEGGSLNSAYVGGIDFEPHNIQIASSEDGIILRRESLSDEGYVAIRIPYVDGKKAYIWMNTGYDRPSFESPLVITSDTENKCAYMDETCLTTSHIFKMAREEDSFCIYIYFGTDAIEEITLYELYLAYSDTATIEDIATGLSEHSLALTEFEDGFIKGNIEAEEDSILFMSVPYERGWMASVDGIKTEIVPLLGDSFIGVPVSEGVHEIELEFIAPYSELGKYMSITGIVLLIIMFCMEWCGRRKLEQK